MFYVYWIFQNLDDNIYEDGYVGITDNIKQRFYKHSKRFAGFYYQVIFTGTIEQVFALEKLLRPNPNIGLNKAIGGLQFGIYSPMTGRKHSEETILKIKLGNLGKNKGKQPRLGTKHLEETKEKLRLINSQRRHRPESKLKVSEALRKRERKQETFDKISKAKIEYYARLHNSLELNGREIKI